MSKQRETLPRPGQGERVLVYERRFVVGGEQVPPDYLLLEVERFVPLSLAAEPERVERNGQAGLALRLDDKACRGLAALVGLGFGWLAIGCNERVGRTLVRWVMRSGG